MFSGKPSLTHKKDSCWPLICQGLCISTRTQQERVRRSLPIFYPLAKITALQWTEYFQEEGKPLQKWGQQQWLFLSSVAVHGEFICQQFKHLHPKPHLPSPFLSNLVLGAFPPCADMHFPSHSWRELLPTEKPQTEIHDLEFMIFFFFSLSYLAGDHPGFTVLGLNSSLSSNSSEDKGERPTKVSSESSH